MKLAKLPWFWIGIIAGGIFMFAAKKRAGDPLTGPQYSPPTEGMTTLRIDWKPAFDTDWYGDGVIARDEALGLLGMPFNSLGIVDRTEHIEIDVQNELVSQALKGALEMHEAVDGVEVLGQAV